MAETIAMKQQLIVMNRHRKRALSLETSDRFLFGLLAMLIGERRLQKVAVILKPATVLAFHKALVKRKSSKLNSNRTKRVLRRKPRGQILIDLVIEMKRRNPSFGYGRISMQILEAFGISVRISRVEISLGDGGH